MTIYDRPNLFFKSINKFRILACEKVSIALVGSSNNIISGCNDIERATHIAKDMVTLYGMSELGPIKYNSGSENVFLGRDYNSPSNVSGQVAFEIDEEVRKIINGCHDKAKEVINAHRKELEDIAAALMEKETLTAEEIQAIVKGETPVDTEEPVIA